MLFVCLLLSLSWLPSAVLFKVSSFLEKGDKFSDFSLYKNNFGAYGVHFPNSFKDEGILNLDKIVKLENSDKKVLILRKSRSTGFVFES